MSPRQRIAIGVFVAALAALGLVLYFGSGSGDSKRKERAEREAKERGSDDESELVPDDPSDPDEPEQLEPTGADAAAGSADPAPDPTATGASSAAAAPKGTTPAAPPSGSQKVDEMHRLVHQEAIRGNWVPVDDNDNPCPPDQIRILYSPPSDLKRYKKGAYFEPLGPSPDDSALEVNGLLICEGYPFIYRGFEAYYRPDSGRWDVFPFPVIEE